MLAIKKTKTTKTINTSSMFFGKSRRKTAFAFASISTPNTHTEPLTNILVKTNSDSEYQNLASHILFTRYDKQKLFFRLNKVISLVSEEIMNFQIKVICRSGGIKGKLFCIEHAIINAFDDFFKKTLPLDLYADKKSIFRQNNYITIDVKPKERKKPGRIKSRKAYPYVKR